jgi:predicted DNA-binding transcriptional regulator AlpA
MDDRITELEHRLAKLEAKLADRALDSLPEDAKLTRGELMSMLDVSTNTLRRMVARGDLPRPFRVGARQCWLAGAVRKIWRERQESAIQDELRRVAPRQTRRWN